MNIWLDDIRPAPEGYVWCHSVNEAKELIKSTMAEFRKNFAKSGKPDEALYVDIIDMDHDLGDYASDGGDGIELLKWYEEITQGTGTYTRFHLHTMNPVGMQNMRAIIKHNNFEEI